MDQTFAALKSELGSRVSFRRLDWDSDEAEVAIGEHSLGSPPASVIADSKGRVACKMESALPKGDMRNLLLRLCTAEKLRTEHNARKDVNANP